MFFTRPIALTFFVLSLIALAFPLIRSKKINRKL
jgi:putative tricarboxylic transport membrane protein